MTTELWMLVASTLLMIAFPAVYGPGYISALGLRTMAGNRENLPQPEGWFARARRAQANLAENLLPFAILVLVAHTIGLHDSTTKAAAVVFFVGRVVHAASYTAGFVPTRAPAYAAGVVAMVVIAVRIATAG